MNTVIHSVTKTMNINNVDISALDWDKVDGLMPAMIQHADTGKILMLGYMNPEALQQTLETQQVTFYSRTKQRLWTKGETSGNTLAFIAIDVDCDQDALLVQARPAGPVCHLNTPTCFGDQNYPAHAFFGSLEQIIAQRQNADPDASYTAKLLQGPMKRAAQKVGEEGVEVALAAATQNTAELVNEAADLLYHLQVLLQKNQLTLADVSAVLTNRHQ